jgi:hypothetical protein
MESEKKKKKKSLKKELLQPQSRRIFFSDVMFFLHYDEVYSTDSSCPTPSGARKEK